LNNRSTAWISDRIAGIVENKAPLWWWVAISIWSLLVGILDNVHLQRDHAAAHAGSRFSAINRGHYEIAWPEMTLSLYGLVAKNRTSENFIKERGLWFYLQVGWEGSREEVFQTRGEKP
jgi:hypothetical protein